MISDGLSVVQHFDYYDQDRVEFPYEKNPESCAYVDDDRGSVYVTDGFVGGKRDAFVELIRTVNAWAEQDRAKGIIPSRHEESYLNRFILDHEYNLLSPSYCYPDDVDLPFERKILALNENRFGGRDYLKGLTDRRNEDTIAMTVYNGMANQMLCYCMYLVRRKQFPSLIINFIDQCKFGWSDAHYNYELNKAFGIQLKEVPFSAGIGIVTDNFPKDERTINFVERELRRAFTFSPELHKEFEPLLTQMKTATSVSVHVRRGDFIDNQHHHDCAPMSYFHDAIDYMNRHLDSPTFFVFSDDIKYAEQMFVCLPKKVFVEGNRDADSYKDMFLMSQCKHHILNIHSSFSFWGAWLNPSKDKIVLCPETSILSDKWIIWGTKDFANKTSAVDTIEVDKINVPAISSYEDVHVCYALHDLKGNYSKYIGTSICSLLENATSPVTVHLIHDDTLTTDNRNKFIDLARSYRQSIQFHSVFWNRDIFLVSKHKMFTQMVFSELPKGNVIPFVGNKLIAVDEPYIFNKDILEVWRNPEQLRTITAAGGVDMMKVYAYADPSQTNFIELKKIDIGEPLSRDFWRYFVKTPWCNADFMERWMYSVQCTMEQKIFEVRSLMSLFYSRYHHIFVVSDERMLECIRQLLFKEDRDVIIFSKDIELYNMRNDMAFRASGTGVADFIKLMQYLNGIERDKRIAAVFTNNYLELYLLLKHHGQEEYRDVLRGQRLLTEFEGGPKVEFRTLVRDL